MCVHCGQPVIHHNTESRLKIVGGSYAQYGAFPWQVEIQVEEDRKWRHQCGGAILGDHTVITAAHCVQQETDMQLRVLVGKHSLSKQDKHQHIYRVVDVIVHPEFRKEGPHSNDIAILKVEGNNTINGIRCNSHVQSICLPDQNVLTRDMVDTCIVTGWGTQIQGSSSISRVLQAATVPLLDLATCRQAQVYGSSNYQILDSMICAGTLEGGVDACGGDSGGPLACKLNGRFVLLGIVSWGEGCAQPNRPGVYTRVSSFIPWINESLN